MKKFGLQHWTFELIKADYKRSSSGLLFFESEHLAMTARLQSFILGIVLFLPNLFFDLDDPIGIPQVETNIGTRWFLTYVRMIIYHMLRLQNITSQEKPSVVSAYDFIVVGAGSAGWKNKIYNSFKDRESLKYVDTKYLKDTNYLEDIFIKYLRDTNYLEDIFKLLLKTRSVLAARLANAGQSVLVLEVSSDF